MCHTYHAPPSLAAAENSSAGGNAFKQMLLGVAEGRASTSSGRTEARPSKITEGRVAEENQHNFRDPF
jgi:hypothetical protein